MTETNYGNLSYCYGRARLEYLRQEQPDAYRQMLENGTLGEHLQNIEEQAWEMEERLVAQAMEKEGVNDNLKKTDQMKWVGLVNNIKHSAREVVQRELIFV